MKILVVSQYFWPESFVINDLSRVLSEMGHEVTVLTGKPNYPEGDIYPGYVKEGCQHESYEGLEVYRVPLRPRGKGGAKNLFLNYISFIVSGIRFFPKLIKNREFDVIFVFGLSPILSAIPAIFIKKSSSHLAIWVQDLWPDSLSSTGYIKNRFVLKVVGLVVRWIYARADTILIQSHAFKHSIKKYVNANKVFYYPNSVLLDKRYDVKEQGKDFPKVLMDILDENFCVVFAGNLGKAQALETITSAAQILLGFPQIKIVLVGSGSMSDWLNLEKERLNLNNLILAGRYPSSKMGYIFSKADALLVSLKNTEIFNYTVPSKVQSYLASGKPIIASINGEAARVLNEADAGVVCAAEDPDELAQAILKVYEMKDDERGRLGHNGRKYFDANYEMFGQAEKLINLLQLRMNNG